MHVSYQTTANYTTPVPSISHNHAEILFTKNSHFGNFRHDLIAEFCICNFSVSFLQNCLQKSAESGLRKLTIVLAEDSLSSIEKIVHDDEVHALMNVNDAQPNTSVHNNIEARSIATQDFWSGIFEDPSQSLFEDYDTMTGAGASDNENISSTAGRNQRGYEQQNGGLSSWKYDSPWYDVKLCVGDVDSTLGIDYVNETNTVLHNILKEVRLNYNEDVAITASSLSLFHVDVFLPESVLQKLKTNINRVLQLRKCSLTTAMELKEVVVMHVLAASYNSNVFTIADPNNKEFFFSTSLLASQYNEIWSAISCTMHRRQHLSN